MALTTSTGLQLTQAQGLAQQMKLLGTDLFNKAASLEGQILSLRSSLTAGTAFSLAPDVDDSLARLQTLLTLLQQRIADVDKVKSDLTIPT